MFSAIFLSINTLVFADVKIAIDEQSKVFPDNVRLAEVLSTHKSLAKVYWPSAAIYKPSTPELETLRIETLDLLNGHSTEETLSSLESLQEELKTWKLGLRQPVKLDFDLARISVKNNPSFKSGEYMISLPERSNTVKVFGAVSESGHLNYRENTCVDTYLQEFDTSEMASLDYVYVIQPNGEVLQVGVAYWNNRCEQVMPGSSIYVPFAEELFLETNKQINQNILKLAVNKVVNKNER